MAHIKSTINNIKNKLFYQNSCRDLIWLINLTPRIGGFSFQRENVFVTFWILHAILSIYVYVYATIFYQIYYTSTYIDSVHSFLNISIFNLIFNSSVWTLTKRSHLKVILELVTKNDDLVTETSGYVEKQQMFLRRIKFVLLAYYAFHFINDFCIFVPTKIFNLNDGTIETCFGLEPMNSTPNREACALIWTFQEFTSMIAVVNYDVSIIFLLAHTTTMFNILHEDVLSLDENGNYNLPREEITERLKNYIVRHSFLLQTVRKLQELYSAAIGVGFGVNAMSLSLFMLLPLKVWLEFGPIVYYSLFVYFLYCFQGQRLTNATEKLERAVYSCGWERFNCNQKKMVLFMLKQAQKPVVLLAAQVVPICMYTFASTMQSIYKFLTVFKL